MASFSTLPASIRNLRPVQVLESNLEKGRMAHGILLKGDDYDSLYLVALAVAQYLLKTEDSPDSHPDFFHLRPAKKARTITVGNRSGEEPNSMRKLIRDLQQTANQGGFKVAVVSEADRMNPAAANAFLKTLEEPPSKTLILLISTRPYDLLDTIRSRCFQFQIAARTANHKSDDWLDWVDQYKDLILKLHLSPKATRSAPHVPMFTIYGLISRFEAILENITNEKWEKFKTDGSISHLSDEEKIALEVGLSKQTRDVLLMQLEEATRMAAIELSHKVPFPSQEISKTISALESIVGLLALNMKNDAALETFFLKLLKIWTPGAS